MKPEAKVEVENPEALGVPAIEKRKQPDVLPRSGPGSSSKSAKSKTMDHKRPKQDVDPYYFFDTKSQPSTGTYCSPFSTTFPNESEASKNSVEASKNSVEASKNSGEASKKSRETSRKARESSKCPYCPVSMTRTNDLRKHVEKVHQGPQEMLCHICNFRCSDIVSYLAHENDHLCKCPHCGYIAKNYRGLPRHKAFCRMNPKYEESAPFQSEGKETGKKE